MKPLRLTDSERRVFDIVRDLRVRWAARPSGNVCVSDVLKASGGTLTVYRIERTFRKLADYGLIRPWERRPHPPAYQAGESHTMPGHEDRIRAHAERVAREDPEAGSQLARRSRCQGAALARQEARRRLVAERMARLSGDGPRPSLGG